MEIATLGRILCAMAAEADGRAYAASEREDSITASFMFALRFVLKAGVQKCIDIADEKEQDDGD